MTERSRDAQSQIEERTLVRRLALGNALRRAREAAGLSQPEMARRTLSNRHTLMRLERARHVPSLARVLIYAEELRTTVGALLGEPVSPGQVVYVADLNDPDVDLSVHATRKGAVDWLFEHHQVGPPLADLYVIEAKVLP